MRTSTGARRRAWWRRWATRKNARGFSLIEVMMAGSLLACGAAAILTSYRTSMGLIEHQRRLAAAVNVTEGKLEELLAADAAVSSTLTPGGHGPEIVDLLGRSTTPQIEAYSVEWTVTSGVPASGYMQIVVETTWTEARGTRFTRFAAYREE